MRNVRNIALILLSVILILSCGGGGSDSAKTKGITEVHITFGARTTVSSLKAAAVPPEVRFILLRVSAPDLPVKEHLFDIAGKDFLEVTIEVPNGKLRHFEVFALDSGKDLRYRGDAYADLTGRPVTLTITMLPVGDAPPLFGGLQYAEIISSTSVMLGWEPATDNFTPPSEMRYLVFVSDTPGGEDFQNPIAVLTGVTTYTVEGLTPGQTYYFIVRALDEGGNDDGNTVEVSVNLPQAPDTLAPSFGGLQSALADSWDTVTLSWNPATDDQTPQSGIVYRIYQSLTPGGEDFTSPTYVSAPGVTTYTVTGLTGGTTYYYVVRAVDASGNEDTNTIEVSVTTPLAALYVDVNRGNDITGDGSQTNPFKTITKAVQVAQAGQTIYVEAGTYDATTGEAFPIQMVPNGPIICTGTSFSTMIDSSTGTAFWGAGGASIHGCYISGDPAVDDRGNVISVSSCDIEGDTAFTKMTGVRLTGDSTVSNSTFANFYSEAISIGGGSPVISNNSIGSISFNGITITGGNALVTQNTISNTDTAIDVSNGNPTISSNTISLNNTGLRLSGGNPSIDGNTFTDNYFTAIYLFSGTTRITNNIITGTGVTGGTADGIRIGQGVSPGVLISGNTITKMNRGIISFDGCSIQGNDINGNITGIEITNATNNQISITSSNLIHSNTAGINLTAGNPLIQGNSLFCNTDFDFGDSRGGGSSVNISNNSWDHDTNTTPSGPVVNSSGQCLVLGGMGTDICYDGILTPAPVYTPFGPAVTGGCL